VKYGIIAITKNGITLALKLKEKLNCAEIYTLKKFKTDEVNVIKGKLDKFTGKIFKKHKILIFIMATGIVVRTISKHIKHKTIDPGILVIDEKGKNVISLLSGHLGGANKETQIVAGLINANPVITTASDLSNKLSVDMIAEKYNCTIDAMDKAKNITALIVNNKPVHLMSDYDIDIPDYLKVYKEKPLGFIIISNKTDKTLKNSVKLMPRNIIIGIGCKKGIKKKRIYKQIKSYLKDLKIEPRSIKTTATIDIKKDEKGIIKTAKALGCGLKLFSPDQIKAVEDNFTKSKLVKEKIGVSNVCEACAYLAGNRSGRMILNKTNKNGVSIAIWEEDIINPKTQNKMGFLNITGIGPGDMVHMSHEARMSILESDVIIGYKTYINLIEDLTIDKKVISSGMKKEIDRCQTAIDEARKGNIVCLISSGDPGIYGMAGLILELIKKEKIEIPYKIIPGITSSSAAASILGAPIMHDFAVISLSDLLTDWQKIKSRLENAAKADFVICIYNPKSKDRTNQIIEAQNILLKYKDKNTPVGIVKKAKREGENTVITTLDKMIDNEIDMTTTIIIGNSATYVSDNKMITPRGYKL